MNANLPFESPSRCSTLLEEDDDDYMLTGQCQALPNKDIRGHPGYQRRSRWKWVAKSYYKEPDGNRFTTSTPIPSFGHNKSLAIDTNEERASVEGHSFYPAHLYASSLFKTTCDGKRSVSSNNTSTPLIKENERAVVDLGKSDYSLTSSGASKAVSQSSFKSVSQTSFKTGSSSSFHVYNDTGQFNTPGLKKEFRDVVNPYFLGKGYHQQSDGLSNRAGKQQFEPDQRKRQTRETCLKENSSHPRSSGYTTPQKKMMGGADHILSYAIEPETISRTSKWVNDVTSQPLDEVSSGQLKKSTSLESTSSYKSFKSRVKFDVIEQKVIQSTNKKDKQTHGSIQPQEGSSKGKLAVILKDKPVTPIGASRSVKEYGQILCRDTERLKSLDAKDTGKVQPHQQRVVKMQEQFKKMQHAKPGLIEANDVDKRQDTRKQLFTVSDTEAEERILKSLPAKRQRESSLQDYQREDDSKKLSSIFQKPIGTESKQCTDVGILNDTRNKLEDGLRLRQTESSRRTSVHIDTNVCEEFSDQHNATVNTRNFNPSGSLSERFLTNICEYNTNKLHPVANHRNSSDAKAVYSHSNKSSTERTGECATSKTAKESSQSSESESSLTAKTSTSDESTDTKVTTTGVSTSNSKTKEKTTSQSSESLPTEERKVESRAQQPSEEHRQQQLASREVRKAHWQNSISQTGPLCTRGSMIDRFQPSNIRPMIPEKQRQKSEVLSISSVRTVSDRSRMSPGGFTPKHRGGSCSETGGRTLGLPGPSSRSCSSRTSTLQKDSSRKLLDSFNSLNTISDGPSCRICRESDSQELLVSPCYCAGTVGLLHVSCLQRWLGASNKTSCEICNFEFALDRKPMPFHQFVIQTRRVTNGKKSDAKLDYYGTSDVMFLQNPGTPKDRRNVICDSVCLMLVTPMTGLTVWLCISGALKYFPGDTLRQAGLFGLSACLLLVYIIWLFVAGRHNLRLWRDWKMFHQKVTLTCFAPGKRTVKGEGHLALQVPQDSPRSPRIPRSSSIVGGVTLHSVQISVSGPLRKPEPRVTTTSPGKSSGSHSTDKQRSSHLQIQPARITQENTLRSDTECAGQSAKKCVAKGTYL